MQYFVLALEFVLFNSFSYVMLQKIIKGNSFYLNLCLYTLFSIIIVLLFPYLEVFLNVYNLLYLDYYAIIVSVTYYLSFIMVLIFAFIKKSKT